MAFQSYKATTKIHLGGTHISELEVVEFDGSQLRRADGTDLKLEYPSAFKGAIDAGWVVAEGKVGTPYVPKPSGIEVRSAKANGTERDVIDMTSVNEEDSDVGKIVSSNLSSPTGDDSRVVGKLSSPKSTPVTVGMDDRKVVREIESSSPIVKKVATGDVEEAISGDNLADLLPEAATSGQPESGIYEEVSVGSGSTSVGSSEDGVVVGSVLDWDMSLHWKVRAKRAVELHRDDLTKINQIMAIEKRGVQKEILRQLYSED